MVFVPEFDDPRVRRTQIGGGNFRSGANEDLLGGSKARVLQRAGQSVENIGLVLNRQQNQRELNNVLDAEVSLKEVILEKQREFLGRKGKNAQGSLLEAERFWDRNFQPLEKVAEEDITEEDVGPPGETEPLTRPDVETDAIRIYTSKYRNLTPRERNVFDFNRSRLKGKFLDIVSRHEDAELLSFNDELNRANINNSIEFAALNPSDIELVEGEEKKIRRVLTASAKAKGVSDEVLANSIGVNVSTLHERVIRSHLGAGDVNAAREHFKNNSEKLVKGTRATLQKLIDEDKNLGEAQALADKISAMEPGQRPTEVQKIQDPDLRAKVEDQLSQNATIKNRADREQNKNDMAEVDRAINRGGTGLPPPSILELERMDSFKRLNVDQKNAFRNILKGTAKLNPPEQVIAETSEELFRMSVSEDPDERQKFLDMNIAVEKQGKLDLAHIDRFRNLQAKMIANQGQPTKSALTNKQISDAKFEAIGWIGPKFARHRAQITTRVNDEILALEEKGGVVTRNQVDEIYTKALSPRNISLLNKRFGDPDNPELATGTVTLPQSLSAFFKKEGLVLSKDRERMGAIESEVQNRVIGIKNRTGKDVPDHIVKEIIETVGNDKVIVEGILFDDDKIVAELTDDQVSKAYVNALGKEVRLTEILALSAEDRNRIARALRSIGKSATMQNMAEFIVLETNLKNRAPARPVRKLQSANGEREVVLSEFVQNLRQRPLNALRSQKEILSKFWGPEGAKIVDQVILEKEAIGE